MPELIELIHSESLIQRKCQHANVVNMIASCEDQNFSFIVMELCPNGALSDLLTKKKFIDFDEWQIIMQQILNGLEFIHSQNIIHRDIKASNILLSEQNVPKIADFGLAIDANAPMERLRTFCGTVSYMSPELVNHRGSNLKSDVWAAAVCGYFMYKAERPFDDDSDAENHQMRVYRRIRNAEFSLKSDRDDAVFEEFVKAGLTIDVNRRATAKQLKQIITRNSIGSICRRKMPRKGEEVSVIVTHIVSANKLYVNIHDDLIDKFYDFQLVKLQQLRLETCSNPGIIYLF